MLNVVIMVLNGEIDAQLIWSCLGLISFERQVSRATSCCLHSSYLPKNVYGTMQEHDLRAVCATGAVPRTLVLVEDRTHDD
jgi:hypothetical protein